MFAYVRNMLVLATFSNAFFVVAIPAYATSPSSG
jgi:hypothetical protein